MFPLTATALSEATLLDGDQLDLLMLALRVVAGVTIFVHGYNHLFRGGRIPGCARWFDSLGMRPSGLLHAWVATVTELGTGVLLVLGLLTPLASAGVIGLMVVAGWTVHRKNFLVFKEGWEYVMILAVLCLAIATIGPGTLSLDEAFGLRESINDGWTGAIIALVVGLVAGIGTLLAFYRPPADAS
jgi:putative oxidoreductase